MKIAIVGDSIIGTNADNKGRLSIALRPFLIDLGLELVGNVGVQGSTIKRWLSGDKFDKEMKKIRAEDPEVLWVNFATNDLHHGTSPTAFARNARDLYREFPSVRKVIWSEGNVEPKYKAKRDRALDEMVRLFERDHPGVLMLLHTRGASGEPYRDEPLHPSVEAHTEWIEMHVEQIEDHLGVKRSFLNRISHYKAYVAGAVAGVIIVAFLS